MSLELTPAYPPDGYEEVPGGGLRPVASPEDDEPVTRDGLHLTALSSVQMHRARFIWDPRIPKGALTLIAGLPGQGKSTLTIHIAARSSRGQLEGDLFGTPVPVLIATAEDALSFVVRPRLEAAGADLDLVHSVSVRRQGLDGFVDLSEDIGLLREKMEEEV